MSAFLCDANLLAAIAREAAKLSPKVDAERVFGLLLDENLKSIGYRYPDAPKISDWFDEGESAFVWETVPVVEVSAVALDEMIGCYEYQSCEHPEWETSAIYDLCKLLRASLAPRIKAEKDAEAAKVAERQRALSALPSLYPKETAGEIRKLLKAQFPTTKFSVITERGSMVSSVRIGWTDGPTAKRVDELTKCFEAGHFDGMTDSYDYATDRALVINGKAYRAACRYVFTNRELSASLMNRCIDQIVNYWRGIDEKPVAVEIDTKWGKSIELQPKESGRQNIRKDVDLDWHTAIHRAASDRTVYFRED